MKSSLYRIAGSDGPERSDGATQAEGGGRHPGMVNPVTMTTAE